MAGAATHNWRSLPLNPQSAGPHVRLSTLECPSELGNCSRVHLKYLLIGLVLMFLFFPAEHYYFRTDSNVNMFCLHRELSWWMMLQVYIFLSHVRLLSMNTERERERERSCVL